MSEDQNSKEQPIVGSELDTTPPNPPPASKPPSGWEMPTPVFRQTSGYLPQGYEKRFVQATQAAEEPDTLTPDGASQDPLAVGTPTTEAVAVEPQPDLSDELTFDEAPVEAQPQKKRSGILGAFFTVIGLLAVLAFVIVFVGVVYYLFLAPSDGSSPF